MNQWEISEGPPITGGEIVSIDSFWEIALLDLLLEGGLGRAENEGNVIFLLT